MTRPRIAFILQLLLSAGAAAALVPVPACSGCNDPWAAPEPYALAIDATILGDFWDPVDGAQVVVGTGGAVVDGVASSGSTRVSHPVDVDLRGVVITDELVIVVGDGGTVAAAPRGSVDWQILDVGVTADLHAATIVETDAGRVALVVGDGVMLVRSPDDGAWSSVTPPDGGWGDLRSVHAQRYTNRIVAVGRGGVIWAAPTPAGPWTREPSGTAEDLTIVHDDLIGGANGTLLSLDDQGQWRPIGRDLAADVVDVFPAILTADGDVYEFNDDGEASIERIYRLGPGLRVLLNESQSEFGYLALGEPGKHRVLANTCEPLFEGRPFLVDDHARTAAAVARADWCDGPVRHSDLPASTRAALAEHWTRAALAEHASVAAFARAVLELMSLAAPPDLLRDTHVALADEVVHATRAFALASRYGGAPRGPGPLAVDGANLERAGDPAAVALGVFAEGCIGESVAAAEAALAADVCRDPEVRAVLAQVARDEARHAALAWRTVRWLVDRFGERVAAPLRRYLTGLTPPMISVGEPDLRAHGRLSARDRAAIHRDVVRDIVRPIADVLLAGPAATVEAHA